MPAYGFNAEDARRIGQLVRAAEHRRVGQIGNGADAYDSAKPGVRLLIGRHEGTSWQTGSTAIVAIYNGEVLSGVTNNAASVATVIAFNQYVSFTTDELCSARWVALGHNGFAWHPIDSKSDCADCAVEAGGVDFRVFPGYERTAVQILGHDNGGCIKWYDVFTCATAAT